MFGLTRALPSIKMLFRGTPLIFKSSTLLFRNIVFFSEAPQYKIFKMIQEINLKTNVKTIAKVFEQLSAQAKQKALQAILNKVFNDQLPIKSVENSDLIAHIKRNHSMYFEFCYFCILRNISNLNNMVGFQEKNINRRIIVKQINEYFTIGFDLVKKIEGNDAIVLEIQLQRLFGNFNSTMLTKIMKKEYQSELIIKSKQAYKLALNKISSLILINEQENRQLQNLVNKNEAPDQGQSRKKKLQQLEEARFQLIQEYSEVILQMVENYDNLDGQKKVKNIKGKKQKKQQETGQTQNIQLTHSQQALHLEPLIAKAIKNYDLVSNRKIESKFCFILKKMLIDTRYQKKLRIIIASTKGSDQKKKQINKLVDQCKLGFKQVYAQACEEIKKPQNQKLKPQILADFISSTVLNRIYAFMGDQQLQKEDFKANVTEQVKKLIAYIQDQVLRKQTLPLVVRILKEVAGIEIQNLVEKVPRRVKNIRRL